LKTGRASYPVIRKYLCPERLVFETLTAFGQDRDLARESIAFWAGAVGDSNVASLTHLILPRGRGVDRQSYCAGLSSAEMARVSGLLDPPGRVLLAQVHSHPGEPFHSRTDDLFSWRSPGFLSIVIPNYGDVTPESFRRWGFHRCDSASLYRPLSDRSAKRLVALVKNLEVTVHEC